MSKKSLKSSIAEPLGKIPLQLVMIVPFVVQIVGAVGIVGYLSFQNSEKAVNKLANKLMDEVSARIEQNLNNYLEIPHQVNKIKLNAIESGLLSMKDISAWEKYLWRLVQLYPEVNYTIVANKDGRVRGVDRTENGTILRLEIDDYTNYNFTFYNTDEKGDRTTINQVIPNNESELERRYWYTHQFWYKEGINAKKASWNSAINPSFIEPTLLVVATEPLYDREGQLQGLMLTSLRLNSTGRFLRSLNIAKTGQAFIIDDRGRLVATSTDEIPFRTQDGKREMFKATESSNPVTRTTATYLATHSEIFNNLKKARHIKFEIDGKRQFLRLLPFRDDKGLNWQVAVVVPESDFMAKIYKNRQHTIIMCIATLGLATIVGIFISRWITKPILRLSQAAQSIASGKLNQNVEEEGLKEVRILVNSFNSMADQLLESFATLEAKNEELKIAEENYRSIFENALEGIFQAAPDGHYISVNLAMSRIYCYESPDEMIATVSNIASQVYVDSSSLQEFYTEMQEKGKVKNFEYRAYRKDGSIIWVQEDARAVRDSSGNVLYYEGLIQDVTARKLQEEELKRQLQELKIEIDHQKRKQEVAQITESGFFQDIQTEIENLKIDDFWN
ncbi:PAS domain S-box protein [Argonema galeatum]|uniref:PAS domain S-box protein n=1 Tax=Argonema galeatum TaxID=2942762 RepID=UPI002011F0FC|nr:PAS domain S-box protein [Argonema galeatum]MCL1467569.1 PAS domain S-box protein [Argonema galeatum A003/A1]